MKKENAKRAGFIIKMITSALLIIVAVVFLAQLIRIYFFSGEGQKFSYIRVGMTLAQCLLFIIPCVIAIIVGAIMLAGNNPIQFVASPHEKLKLVSKFSLSEENEKEKKKFDHKIFVAKMIMLGVVLLCLVMVTLYLVQPKHFPTLDATSEILRQQARMMMYCCLPFLAIAFGVGLFYVFYEAKIIDQEVKFILTHKEGAKPVEEYDTKKSELTLRIIQGVVLAVAVTFIIVGICNGGPADVLKKAANICTECIGLG